jgi:hypothetical protein
MTYIKDKALKLALEALEGIHPGNMTPMAEEYWNKAITAIKQALAAPVQQESVWLCRSTKRTETGMYQAWQVCSWTEAESHFDKKPNYEYKQFYTFTTAQPAPVQEPVGVFVEDDDIGHVRLIPHQQLKLKDGDKLYTTPPAAQPAPVQPVAWRLNGESSLGHGKVFGKWKSGKPPKDVADLASVDKNWSLEFAYTTPPAAPVPLTQQQVVDGFCKTPHQTQYVAVFDAGVRFAEAAHGITEKGQP